MSWEPGLGTAAKANKVAAGVGGVLDATDATTTNKRAHRYDLWAPTGAIENFPRYVPTSQNNTLTSGKLRLVGLPLLAGQVVTSLSFMSSTTGTTLTHWWFALYTPARVLLAQSADQLTAAFSAFVAPNTVALSAPQTITVDGLYYAGIMVAGTTPPALLIDAVSGSFTSGLAPIMAGDTSDSGLLGVAPATAGAIASGSAIPYCYAL